MEHTSVRAFSQQHSVHRSGALAAALGRLGKAYGRLDPTESASVLDGVNNAT